MPDYVDITCPKCGILFKVSIRYIKNHHGNSKIICPECKYSVEIEIKKASEVIPESNSEKTAPESVARIPSITTSVKNKSMWFILILLPIVIVVLLVNQRPSTNTKIPSIQKTVSQYNAEMNCFVEIRSYLDKMRPIMQEWDDTVNVANTTPRIVLSQPLLQLQAVRRKAQEIEPQLCVQEAHRELLSYMDNTIKMFVAFAADSNSPLVLIYKEKADTSLSSFFKKITYQK